MKLVKLEKTRRPGSLEYKKGKEIAHYSMVEINRSNEIILQKRGNIYFIIHLYLDDSSQAAEAFVISNIV